MTLAKPIALAAGALLLAALPARAQDKIAPSRNYNAYSDTPRERPDRNYGLPSFGMPGAVLPQQKTMATKGPGASGFAPGATAPDIGLSQPDNNAALLPPPGTAGPPAVHAAPGAGTSPDLDFFAKQGGDDLPKPTRSAASNDGMDTPLFTTPDGASDNATSLDSTTTDSTALDRTPGD